MTKTTKPMSYKHLRCFVTKATERGGCLNVTVHADAHHPERDLKVWDLLCGLLADWSVGRKEYDPHWCNWKYEIKTTSLAGRKMTLFIVPETQTGKVKVITRW
jgi:hypothetical protein